MCVCDIICAHFDFFWGFMQIPILYANRQLTAHVYYQEKNNATKKWKKNNNFNYQKKKIKKEKCAS